jgi:prepilin-type N-terminal cleavage/methylation domain-containing protein
MKRRASSSGGFTLLEILVSLALLSIAMVAIFQLFSANLRGLAAADDYVNAVLTAESKMRETLAVDEDKFEEKSWTEDTDDGYHVDGVITATAKDRTENLPVDLMEVKITVHWTRGTREKSLTLRSMRLVARKV